MREKGSLSLFCLLVCGANVGSMEAKQRPRMAATHNSIINPTSPSSYSIPTTGNRERERARLTVCPMTRKLRKNSSCTSVLGLGVKLQTLEAFPSKTMMKMVHHNHHYRPLSPFDNDSSAADGDGPTTSRSVTHHINDVSSGGFASAAVIHSGGAAVRPLQPFHISTSTAVTTTHPAFKSPGAMAASLGFPFTNAQWKELERQAMVYKYMMASVPVPADLLIPTSVTAASRSPCMSLSLVTFLFMHASASFIMRFVISLLLSLSCLVGIPLFPTFTRAGKMPQCLFLPSIYAISQVYVSAHSPSLTPCLYPCLQAYTFRVNSGFNLRLSSSTDPEPGRCRRTDGKKWRCSRDVAPNHKYCERHMHRGRPRSRKPVEVHGNSNNNQQIKRARHDYHPFPTSSVTGTISNPAIRNGGSSSQFLPSTTSQPYHESSLSLDKFGLKAVNFESVAAVPSDNEPRGLDWMLKGDPISMAASDPEWQALMQNKVGLTTQNSCNNNASISSPNYKETLYLNSYPSFNSRLDQQSRRYPLFLYPLTVPVEDPQSKPRGFIDAWSNAETGGNNVSANKSPVASNGKLSLSCLDLSIGGGGSGSGSVDEEMGTIQMGLGLMEPDGNTENGTKTDLANWLTPAPWVASTPGGPLAEVLRPSKVVATNEAPSNPSSPVITNAESGSPLATMVSSPSGVLQKTLASWSDSSSNSSPTVASSRENALLWFNQSKLASSN